MLGNGSYDYERLEELNKGSFEYEVSDARPRLSLLHNNSYEKLIHDYEPLEALGEGSYGCLWKAVKKHSGDVVAIKKLKDKFNSSSWKKCMNLREVKALRGVGDYPNIVKLKQLIVEDNILHLVMECMDMTLTQFMKKRVKMFSDGDDVCGVVIQLFQALAHMHQRWYFHHDLKPDNILVYDDVVKVADLGMAREVSTDGDEMYTKYVMTLWYRPRRFCWKLQHIVHPWICGRRGLSLRGCSLRCLCFESLVRWIKYERFVV
ncbi:hypothetical protein Sjap_002557 [Stephania japonica]|uniref:Protein kinase domain-containing protein n=1 Tax=Stephania japonica TaxID=461633 RepID=A0AAP0PSR0_9MAGN